MSITFIRHTGTTGVAAATGEGLPKPELVFNVDQITKPAIKLAAHHGLSYEITADWPAFESYCGRNSSAGSWTLGTIVC